MVKIIDVERPTSSRSGTLFDGTKNKSRKSNKEK